MSFVKSLVFLVVKLCVKKNERTNMRTRKHYNLWKRWIVPAVIVFCLAATAFAQVTITGPTESLAGDLVVLQMSEATPSGPTEAEGNRGEAARFIWTVIPDDISEGKFRVCDDGKTLVFASRLSGTYHFILSAVDGNGVTAVKHKLENKSLSPTPNPSPGPIPTPEPEPAPLPDPDHTAIGKFADEKAKELVKSQFFDKEKNALGEAFLATAKQIDNGELISMEDGRVNMRINSVTYLNSVSKDSSEAWKDWNIAMGTELERFKIEELPELGKVYKTIGVALVDVSAPNVRANANADCPTGTCPTPQTTRYRWR